MNQHIQTLLNFIRQSENLNADEKKNFSEAANDVENDLNSKDKDLEFEAALERVRSVALSMKKPDDSMHVCEALHKELLKLNFKNIRNSQIVIYNDIKESFLNYEFSDYGVCGITEIFYNSSVKTKAFVGDMHEARDAFAVYALTGKELDEWKEYRKISGQLQDYKLDAANELYYYWYSIGTGAIGISTFKPIDEGQLKILKRFRNVFDLAYRRYIDIEQAETQAKESKIEASLERVRSRTLAMNKSDELAETAEIVFKQLSNLDTETNRYYIIVFNDETSDFETWITEGGGKAVNRQFKGNINKSPVFHKMYNGWKAQKKSITIDLHAKDLADYNLILLDDLNVSPTISQKRSVQSVAYFSNGCIGMDSIEPQTVETINLLERFAGVFNLTYTRYNDLQNAEAQTYKENIEVALERVRARALAMQEPEELKEVAQVLRNEMGMLGVEELETCCIYFSNEIAHKAECWYALKDQQSSEKKLISDHFALDLNDTWVGREMLQFYNSTANQISFEMKGTNRKEWIKYCEDLSTPFRGYYGEVIPDRIYHMYKFSNGAVGAASSGDISDESKDLLKRIASVFSLAYSRYKDLSKARIDLFQLKEEKKKSDALLLNILPAEIADELKMFGKSYARKHEQVTILFADIKGFSSIAENLSADELVTQLDECFRAFDKIVEKHGLEKIKTIGDAYICACGLPKPVPDNAAKTILAALDMLDFVKGFGITKKIQNLPAFEFRVGIHTGPVITGVVGLKKFTYDIWGDAVNMAARMEQHGEAGKINISGSTYQLIKDKFSCNYRGKIEAKNKGEVDMYFVENG